MTWSRYVPGVSTTTSLTTSTTTSATTSTVTVTTTSTVTDPCVSASTVSLGDYSTWFDANAVGDNMRVTPSGMVNIVGATVAPRYYWSSTGTQGGFTGSDGTILARLSMPINGLFYGGLWDLRRYDADLLAGSTHAGVQLVRADSEEGGDPATQVQYVVFDEFTSKPVGFVTVGDPSSLQTYEFYVGASGSSTEVRVAVNGSLQTTTYLNSSLTRPGMVGFSWGAVSESTATGVLAQFAYTGTASTTSDVVSVTTSTTTSIVTSVETQGATRFWRAYPESSVTRGVQFRMHAVSIQHPFVIASDVPVQLRSDVYEVP